MYMYALFPNILEKQDLLPTNQGLYKYMYQVRRLRRLSILNVSAAQCEGYRPKCAKQQCNYNLVPVHMPLAITSFIRHPESLTIPGNSLAN